MEFSILVTAMAMANSAFAQETQKWTATSRTSMAITGSITISGNRINLENGQSILLRPVAPESGKPGIYTIDPPGNPTLLHGNKLCGDKPPTYILIYQEGHSLYLHVFDGPDIPRRLSGLTLQKGICATYNYEKMS
jgi:hypothetical protein